MSFFLPYPTLFRSLVFPYTTLFRSLNWNPWTAAFVQRLRELGWIEGRTVAIEYRWAEGRNCEDDIHLEADELDRKSTRLNSSHRCNSYAVFCLKKKRMPSSARKKKA